MTEFKEREMSEDTIETPEVEAKAVTEVVPGFYRMRNGEVTEVSGEEFGIMQSSEGWSFVSNGGARQSRDGYNGHA
jgi:hypothetical protein